jgi:hypothetical protein
LALDDGRLPLALLVVSDGAGTRGEPRPVLAAAAALGSPVLWWRPPVPTHESDAWIAALRAPARVVAGEAIPLALTVGANGPSDGDLLVTRDGRPLRRERLTLIGGETRSLSLSLPPADPGLHEIAAELVSADRTAANHRRRSLVDVAGRAEGLLLARRPEASAVLASLRLGGWPIADLTPAAFTAGALARRQVLILEGLSVTDLAEADWQAIARSVRRDGLGLLVLGGPGTFGSGGYRHGTLEGLLPILSESTKPLPPATLLFALDKSGSMQRPTAAGASRLALARRAVVESARLLQPEDRAGLLVFDAEVRTLLGLERRADQAAAIAGPWELAAGGGTRLAPVLETAVPMLAAAGTEQRLLILVTDGKLSDADRLPAMEDLLRGSGVTLIAIAVGEGADTETLGHLAQASGGRLLIAEDAAELPRLMEAEVQERRTAVGEGPVSPRLAAPLPFFAAGTATHWPPISAYQVTRLRPGSEKYLAAPTGEPLLAAGFSGTGRVAALPAGLGAWAPDWPTWSGWGIFLGGLIQWVAAADPDPELSGRVEQVPGELRLTVEATGPGGDWLEAAGLPVEVRDPAGSWQQLTARPQAPGRYALAIPAPLAGRYDLLIGPEAHRQRLALIHEPIEELVGDPTPSAGLDGPQREGLVRAWSPALALALPQMRGNTRAALAALALAVFLAVLVTERMPPRREILGRSEESG